MAKSRFKKKSPGRLLTYLSAGVLVLGIGGIAAEHGGPTISGSLVAAKAQPASQPAPPAPAPAAKPKPGGGGPGGGPSGGGGAGANHTPPPSGNPGPCPGGTTLDSHGHPECPSHTPNHFPPGACWAQNKNGDYHIYNDNDTNGKGQVKKRDQKNEKCEASGEEPTSP